MSEKPLFNSIRRVFSLSLVKGVNVPQQKTYELLIFHLLSQRGCLDNTLYFFLTFLYCFQLISYYFPSNISDELKFMWLDLYDFVYFSLGQSRDKRDLWRTT